MSSRLAYGERKVMFSSDSDANVGRSRGRNGVKDGKLHVTDLMPFGIGNGVLSEELRVPGQIKYNSLIEGRSFVKLGHKSYGPPYRSRFGNAPRGNCGYHSVLLLV